MGIQAERSEVLLFYSWVRHLIPLVRVFTQGREKGLFEMSSESNIRCIWWNIDTCQWVDPCIAVVWTEPELSAVCEDHLVLEHTFFNRKNTIIFLKWDSPRQNCSDRCRRKHLCIRACIRFFVALNQPRETKILTAMVILFKLNVLPRSAENRLQNFDYTHFILNLL